MTVDAQRLERVYAYILAVASEADGRPVGLGPIHLLKYAYLADLSFAQSPRGAGRGYTGVAWTFHNFGPWSVEAHKAIGPTVLRLGAHEETFEGQGGVAIRWTLRLEDDADQFGTDLPASVAGSVRREVKRYGADTASLLHHVYDTPPIRSGRPGQPLDLSTVDPPETIDAGVAAEVAAEVAAVAPGKLSRKASERRQAAYEDARTRIRVALARAATKRVPASPPPRYDQVFLEGTALLDALAGPPPPHERATVTIDPSIWERPRLGKLPR